MKWMIARSVWPARSHAWQCALICSVLVALHVLPGCDSNDKPDGEPVSQDAVGTGFSSPEALVRHISSLTESEEPDFEGYYALFYPENRDQENWLRFAHEWMLPRAACDQAARERFGEGIYHDPREAGEWTMKNVQLKEVTDRRATVSFENINGEVKQLQLVQIGSDWWISGYTWEHYPSWDAQKLAEAAEASVGLGDRLRALAARVRAGEFQSAEEVEEEFEMIRLQHNLESLSR